MASSKIVAALDIGTSRSAWAFSIQGFAEDSVIIRVPEGASKSVSSDKKTDTAVLLNARPPHRVEAFGRAAVELFIERSQDAEGSRDLLGGKAAKIGDSPASSEKTGMLFRWFKKELCERRGYQSVDDPIATADGGQEIPLLVVMSAVLRHFKDDVLKYLSSRTGVSKTIKDVIWVATIPAIYDDFAKRFMRVAAHKAGLIDKVDSPELQLCLEPEAACLAVNMREARPLTRAGTKVMILDCGGGTIDITTHDISSVHPTLSLREILAPTGGAWGSSCVDDDFKKFFSQFVGDESFANLRHTSAFYNLLNSWEEGKIAFGDGHHDRVRLNLVEVCQLLGVDFNRLQELCAAHNNRYKTDLERHVTQKKFIVILPRALVRSFFAPTLSKIAACLRSLKRNGSLSELKNVFLVGGFSSSPLIEAVARAELEENGCTVVPIFRPDVAVVRGAVLFANNAEVFKSRVARLTYGVESSTRFDGNNPEHVRRRSKNPSFDEDGKELIDCFSAHVRAGEDIPLDGVFPKTTYVPVKKIQPRVMLSVLASHQKDIAFPDKGAVFQQGSVTVPLDMTVDFKDRGVDVQFVFGGTEFVVKCFCTTSGRPIGTATISLVQEVEEAC